LAAQELNGGAVFPALVWGVPRDSFNIGIAGEDVERIAGAFGTELERWQGFAQHGGMDTQEQWLFYQRLLRMTLEHIAGFGFRSIYICSGHGPFIHWVEPVATAFTRATQMAGALVTTDWANVFEPAGFSGDHGGKSETSAMMGVDPEMVDLAELDRHPEYAGVGARQDAPEANELEGKQWLKDCATAIAQEAKWLVDNYPKLPPRHAHKR